jgi:hypothetical protein
MTVGTGEFKICRHPRHVLSHSFFPVHFTFSVICARAFICLLVIVSNLFLEPQQGPRKELLRKCLPMQQERRLMITKLPPMPCPED